MEKTNFLEQKKWSVLSKVIEEGGEIDYKEVAHRNFYGDATILYSVVVDVLYYAFFKTYKTVWCKKWILLYEDLFILNKDVVGTKGRKWTVNNKSNWIKINDILIEGSGGKRQWESL